MPTDRHGHPFRDAATDVIPDTAPPEIMKKLARYFGNLAGCLPSAIELLDRLAVFVKHPDDEPLLRPLQRQTR